MRRVGESHPRLHTMGGLNSGAIRESNGIRGYQRTPLPDGFRRHIRDNRQSSGRLTCYCGSCRRMISTMRLGGVPGGKNPKYFPSRPTR